MLFAIDIASISTPGLFGFCRYTLLVMMIEVMNLGLGKTVPRCHHSGFMQLVHRHLPCLDMLILSRFDMIQ